ncbi:MAG: HEAT repeat domain-containing protein [Campylobacterota bacterium]|nr:HEAT repeat domain-containing protein [Campylobacterota bacterium]
MAFVKKHLEQEVTSFPSFDNLQEAIDYFQKYDDFEHRKYALEEMVAFENGASFLVEVLSDTTTGKAIDAEVAAVLATMDPDEAPIEEVMELLKLHNAYIRNLAISVLQDYGEAIKYYIVKFLIGDDRDLRIFAINVLGDVSFPESRDMLIELLEGEADINVAMTAVDYMAEIGEAEDVALLESLKEHFNHDPYVVFGVDNAIRMIQG